MTEGTKTLSERYATVTDNKMRFGGLLENPVISKVQRDLLDGGRVQELGRVLAACPYASLLDVGCGLGECSILCAAPGRKYYGIDNSARRVAFASAQYPRQYFLAGDALALPFRPQSFDMVTLIDTSHHLPDERLRTVLQQLQQVSRQFVVVSDPVLTPGQSRLSSFFYRLDRGACFRNVPQMETIFRQLPGLRLQETSLFRTSPGLYCHAVFILKIV